MIVALWTSSHCYIQFTWIVNQFHDMNESKKLVFLFCCDCVYVRRMIKVATAIQCFADLNCNAGVRNFLWWFFIGNQPNRSTFTIFDYGHQSFGNMLASEFKLSKMKWKIHAIWNEILMPTQRKLTYFCGWTPFMSMSCHAFSWLGDLNRFPKFGDDASCCSSPGHTTITRTPVTL